MVDTLNILVPSDASGERIDSFLASHLTDYSRSRLATWIREGKITLEGEAVRPRYRVRDGDCIRVEIPAPEGSGLVPQPMDLRIAFADDDLVIVDKPSGVVVHPGAGHPDGTLVNGLLHEFGTLSPIGLPERPGIVHRIDAGTSGLLVCARTERAHHHLARLFSAHDVDRVYRALVWDHGLPDSGTIETMYTRHHKDRRKFTGQTNEGKRAVTHWTVVERIGPCALVEARLETGRTHQIRVHFSECGAPLLGDQTYGRRRRIDHIPELRRLGFDLGLSRQALHAAVLGFEHPVTGERVRFESPLPADIQHAIAALKGER